MKTYPSHEGCPMLEVSFEKLGRMLRERRGKTHTRSARLGVNIARLIVRNRVLLAQTVLAVAGYPDRRGHAPVPWPEPERLAILGAIAYANRQWMAGIDPITFGVETGTQRGATFQAMAARCGERVELAMVRRPANALNVEPIQPHDRCRLRTPPNWGDFDPRGARWLASGGDAMVLGVCWRGRCPRLAAVPTPCSP